MKPSWNDAPEWAKYVAKDSDGAWCWYECEPELGVYGWVSNGKVLCLSNVDWEDSLEKKPNET